MTTVVKVSWPNELQGTQLMNPFPPTPNAVGSEIGCFQFSEQIAEDEVPLDYQWGFTMWIGYWPNYDVRFMIGNYVRIVRFIVDRLSTCLD